MWKMYDDDTIECLECWSPLGPPPQFTLPPPPRPPAFGQLANCDEAAMSLKAQRAWDSDICEAMPIVDAGLYSSQSVQTTAMIAVFSLLLVLVILISSLVVWKNKRKVQNFLPCKTPTRGPHLSGVLSIGHSGSATYEDPDVHLGHHRPLVIRHHHNVELLHGKGIHYPSGYPMTRSPPFLVSSSPGPDPYRSHDNVYEELGPGCESDGDSDPAMNSDDDFAEDELSLAGERATFAGPASTAAAPAASGASTSATEVGGSSVLASPVGAAAAGANVLERNSVLSSSSSSHDTSTATAASTTSSLTAHTSNSNTNNNNNNGGNSGCAATGGSKKTLPPNGSRSTAAGCALAGLMRHGTGPARGRHAAARNNNYGNEDFLNSSGSSAAASAAAETSAADMLPIQRLYDEHSNLMSLAYVPPQMQPHRAGCLPPPAQQHHHLNASNNNNNVSLCRSARPTLESEVERRNRINTQLSRAPAVATIFREHANLQQPRGGATRWGQSLAGLAGGAARARTNPRPIERRNRIAAPPGPIEPAYCYAEPLYLGYPYNTCDAAGLQQRLAQSHAAAYHHPAYITSDYAAAVGARAAADKAGHMPYCTQPRQLHGYAPAHAPAHTYYARGGDSSFGSDSGYSHHTPASSIGRQDYEVVASPPPPPAAAKPPGRLGGSLKFSWHRRRPQPVAAEAPIGLCVPQPAATASTSSSNGRAMSGDPGNNNNNGANSPLDNATSMGSRSVPATATPTPTASAMSPAEAASRAAHNNNAAAALA